MAAHRILALVIACALQGCIVSTVIGTAVDVGVAVVKVPIKVGKTVYDATTGDEEKKKQENEAGNDKNNTVSTTPHPANVNHP